MGPRECALARNSVKIIYFEIIYFKVNYLSINMMSSDMLYGRDAEMEALQRRYEGDRFEFVPLYGRRRVGKTYLLKEFARGKNAVYYQARPGSLTSNLRRLARLIGGRDVGPIGMDELLDMVLDRCRDQRFLLIIDEYPNLMGRDNSVSGELQSFIDDHKDEMKLFLILCGSSISMMEHEVLGYKSPLYGRRTGSIKLLPLPFIEARKMLSGFNDEDQMRIYTMVGGIPLYLSKFDPSISLRDNIIGNFLRVDSFFADEPFMTLIEDFENPLTYYSIISAIAGGASRNSDIATRSGVRADLCSRYLRDLTNVGVITKTHPVDNPKGKMVLYHVDDELLRFHFAHIMDHEGPDPSECEEVADSIIGELQDDLGPEFEKICGQYLRMTIHGALGKWWGQDPVERRAEEIDLVLTKKVDGRKVGYFAECKYRNEKVGPEVLETLIRRSGLVRGYDERRFVIFSKSGFDDRLQGRDVILVSWDDIVSTE